ncbi:secreted RxLR effector protein 78-like [Silene latifolia]|uniref:secreted RxLR effector protein 78-like n=1 Tax=Silene latifolia TaxID=37657 RepID=UPI003D772976
MLTQSLVKGYGQRGISPRCLIKVDIKKAFDSLQWEFIDKMFQYYNFPQKFKNWILGCITSTWFSLKINGDRVGFFKGEGGLRQGDPLSPFLFVMSMEILSRTLRYIHKHPQVSYHPKCVPMRLNHLIFADDLMLFVRGDIPSVAAVT